MNAIRDWKKEVITTGHPDDIKDNNEAIKIAHDHIDDFFEKRREDFVRLVLGYADTDAEDRLRRLREDFWGSLPYAGPAK